MANILLINAREATVALFHTAIKDTTHVIQTLTFAETEKQAPCDSYNIVFIESAMDCSNLTDRCGFFQETFKDSYIVLILPVFDKSAVQKSYLVCDGSIVLPEEHGKLRRIIDWYIAADHMRRIDALKDKDANIVRTLVSLLDKNKILTVSILALTLVLGAIIGLFWSEKSTGSFEEPLPQTMKEKILHELRK